MREYVDSIVFASLGVIAQLSKPLQNRCRSYPSLRSMERESQLPRWEMPTGQRTLENPLDIFEREGNSYE